jgi:hypothetical protein
MQCANPLCQAESLYFRSGTLHCIDSFEPVEPGFPGEHRQLIWLCAECSRSLVVETWRPPGQQLRSSPATIASRDRRHAAEEHR